MTYLLVAFGSAIGGVLRYWLGGLMVEGLGPDFPWETLVINVTGSLVIGLFNTLTGPDGRFYVPGKWRLCFMTGVCGGYTTFSSFSLQSLGLAQSGQLAAAAAYIGLSLSLCLFGVWLGHTGARYVNVRH